MPLSNNDEQIEYWNTVSGPKWVAMQEDLDRQLEPLQAALLDHIAAKPGDSILDIGCGCGATSLALAKMVGDSGRVLGVDISRPMLEHAAKRAKEAGLNNVAFEEADAQSHALDNAEFDTVTSRFGIMFFADPVAAFQNFKSSLKSNGQLSFMCWRAMQFNPWMTIPIMAAAPHVELPPPQETDAPGPFAFADEVRLKKLLQDAGFGTISIKQHDAKMILGSDRDPEDSVDFITKIGPLSRILQDADTDTVTRVKDAIREAMAPYQTPGGAALDASVWLVKAQ